MSVAKGLLPDSQLGGSRQRLAGCQRIQLDRLDAIARGDPGQALQGQTKPHRRITRIQEQVLAPQEPGAAAPGAGVLIAGQRQSVTHDLGQASIEDLGQAQPLGVVIQVRLQRIDVDRQLPLLPEVVPGVLVAGNRMLRIDAQAGGELGNERRGGFWSVRPAPLRRRFGRRFGRRLGRRVRLARRRLGGQLG